MTDIGCRTRNDTERVTMSRLFSVCAVLSFVLIAAFAMQLPAGEEHTNGPEWSVRAQYTDTCSCAPTCPCFFGSAPTHRYCEGITLIEIQRGHYEEVRLDGVKVLAVHRGAGLDQVLRHRQGRQDSNRGGPRAPADLREVLRHRECSGSQERPHLRGAGCGEDQDLRSKHHG